MHRSTLPITRAGKRRLGKMLAASCFWLLVALAPRAAHAADQGRTVLDAIDLRPGATCLEAELLADRVRSWLETDSIEPTLTVEVRGNPDSPRIVEFRTLRAGRLLAYRKFGPGPERCDHLHEALGLAIAMAIKASLVDELAAQVDEARGIEGRGKAIEPLRWSLAIDALGTLDVLPGGSFGLGGRVERALTSSFGLRIGVVGLASLGDTFSGIAGHFDAWLVAAQADLCGALELSRRLRARACMGMMGGGVAAQGFAFSRSAGAIGPWIAAANGLGLVDDTGDRWALEAMVGVILPLERTTIVVRDSKTGSVVGERDLLPAGEFVALGPVCRF